MSDFALSWDHPQVRELITLALREDIGGGDVTTEACVSPELAASGAFLAKQDLVVAGTPLLELVYDQEEVEVLEPDGTAVERGRELATVRGSARRLLTLERTALNLLQRTCGVATTARAFTEAIKDTSCRLLDTRKTSPGMRITDKLAVRAGGGRNHRLGLFDAILIKNNHIDAAGGVKAAIERARSTGHPAEIEVRDLAELRQALEFGADHVLLDNFSPEAAAEAVAMACGRAVIEVSGNVSLENIEAYAKSGADFVSVGALTHSAPAADISFRLEKDTPTT